MGVSSNPQFLNAFVMWPQEPFTKGALFSENFVAQPCENFGIHDAAASVVVDYAMYKQSNVASLGRSLKQLVDCLQVVPISSADCEPLSHK